MFKKLFKSVREYKKVSIYSIIFIILEVLVEVIIPYTMADLLDNGISAGNMNVVTKCGITLIIYALCSLLFGTLAGVFASRASCGFAKNLRQDMYYKIQDFSFKNIDKFSTSSIVTRLTTDVSNVQNAFQMLIRIAFRAPLMLIFSFIMAFVINAKMSIIFVVVIPLLASILFVISRFAMPLFKHVFEAYDELNNDVQENVRGIRVVKSYVMEKHEKEKFGKISKTIYDRFYKAEKLVIWNAPIMQFCTYLTIILIAWLGAHMIVSDKLTTGELTSLITYSGTILTSLMMVSMIFVMLTLAVTSAKRIAEILDEIPSITNPKNPITEVKDGSIIFKNVSFSYVDKEDKLCLKNVNIKIKSGETIGIIGGTGSGKSSLVNLISRLYDVTKGEVLVGNVNVKNYDLKTLRDSVSVVLQKNVLFSGTIESNLRWGNKNATLEEIKEASKIACADEFVDRFPDGYSTKIEQGGTNVSGGQKQRLCIARALLKSPKILILDDSTSAVDTKTDAVIRQGFKNSLPNTTKIIIAQRLSSVEESDMIIVMDNGTINGIGTHDELLKNNAIYQDIYQIQNQISSKGVEA